MNKLVSKFCNKEMITKILVLFLIIQPLLDIYILFEPKIVAFFRFSPSTIIRTLFIGILFLLAFFTLKWSKKHVWIIGYIILVFAYTVLHHLNALNPTIEGVKKYDYSIFSELFYIIRMLFPLIIILISYYLDFSEKKIEKIVKWLLILISGSLVVTNLLGISLASYSSKIIEKNIFVWFTDRYENYSYMVLASRGFFSFANRTSALELLITPIWFYIFMKNPSKANIALTVMHIIAMFMLGTKVATIGIIILLILSMIIYFYYCFIKKEFKISAKVACSYMTFLVICAIIVPFSPALNRNSINEKREENYEENAVCKKMIDITLPQTIYTNPLVEYETEDEDSCPSTATLEKQKIELVEKNMELLKEEEKRQYLLSFIEAEYNNFSINSTFILKSYPYQEDPYFWYEIMKRPLMERTDYRNLEQKMLDKTKETKSDLKTELYGITYIRMSNIFNLEKDFLSHYYTLGWIGLILLLFPYPIIVIAVILMILFHFEKKATCYNVMLLMAVGITLFASFYSGNVMDGLTVTLILGFVMGQLLRNVFVKKEPIKENKKLSILIPTYNDAESICETIDSVYMQTYKNWELVVIDDGSTDNTKEVIKQYKKMNDLDDKITYIYQKNTDQLKALIHGSKFITGDYVSVLHSDDLLSAPDAVENIIKYFNNHLDLDAIIADLLIINEQSKITGKQKVMEYMKSEKIPAMQLLWLGRNLYVDVAIHTKESFLKNVKENYLTWNTPFWLTMKDNIGMLNVKKVDFEFYKYRIHKENYINNEIGKLNVINGELRTATRLMKYYTLPEYQKQYTKFRIFSKLHLLKLYTPKYSKKETENKAEVVEFIIKKRFPEGYQDNVFLNSLVEFYRNYKERKIEFSKIYKGEKIYLGNEMRMFNKQLVDKQLPNLYLKIIEEMKKGFNEIIVKTEEEREKAIILTKFLCIYPYVKITKK